MSESICPMCLYPVPFQELKKARKSDKMLMCLECRYELRGRDNPFAQQAPNDLEERRKDENE